MELYFIATPAVGEYYFLHPREQKKEYYSINEFYSKRGTSGALILDRESAEKLVAEYFVKGIIGAETFRLINIDQIFGFLVEQKTEISKQHFIIQNPQCYEQQNYSHVGQRI